MDNILNSEITKLQNSKTPKLQFSTPESQKVLKSSEKL